MAHPVMWFEVMGKNADALQAFYRQAFGWTINVNNPMKYGEVDTGAGRGIPGGVGQQQPGASSPQRWVTFYVETPDISATLTDIERLGGKVALPRTRVGDGTIIGLFEDPEGHVIGLVEHSANGSASA
jgi:predicted enzyme related to lactoylglutathione lyase